MLLSSKLSVSFPIKNHRVTENSAKNLKGKIMLHSLTRNISTPNHNGRRIKLKPEIYVKFMLELGGEC